MKKMDENIFTSYPFNSILICPSCHGDLKLLPKALRCSTCGQLVNIDRGFPDFVRENDFEWGELSSEQMDWVVQQARSTAWYVPLLELGEKDPFLAYYILDRSRIGWLFHCLHLRGNEICIDLGSGWGNIAFSLADWYKTVFSVETVRARVEFQTIRREQEGKKNVFPIRSTLLSLPFPDNTADLVVCNGVFEWIGLSDFDQSVMTLQSNFLSEVFRILKPGGCLYIGIENRYSALSFLGAKDHSGLPFTNLLPRPLADFIVRHFRPKEHFLTTHYRNQSGWPDYRTYTYSLSGYHRLLRHAGFTFVEDYWVWPIYNAPHFSGSFQGNSLKFLTSNLISNSRNSIVKCAATILQALPAKVARFISKKMWPSFLLFAFKGAPEKRLQDEIQLMASSDMIVATTTRISGPKYTFLQLNNGKVSKSVSILNSNISNHNKRENSFMPTSVPAKLTHRENYTLSISPGVDGKPCNPQNIEHAIKAMEWLITFQRDTAQGSQIKELWQQETAFLIQFLGGQEFADQLPRLAAYVFDSVSAIIWQEKLQVTASHGDFQYRNILIGSDGTLHVIDWDDYISAANPLLDVGTYILMLADGNCTALYDMVRGKGPLNSVASAAIQAYSKATGVDIPRPDSLIGYALIHLLYRDSITLSAHGKSIIRAFPGGCKQALKFLRTLPLLSSDLPVSAKIS